VRPATDDTGALTITLALPDAILAKFRFTFWKASRSGSPVPSFGLVPTLMLAKELIVFTLLFSIYGKNKNPH
jgi:hypothetical protein